MVTLGKRNEKFCESFSCPVCHVRTKDAPVVDAHTVISLIFEKIELSRTSCRGHCSPFTCRDSHPPYFAHRKCSSSRPNWSVLGAICSAESAFRDSCRPGGARFVVRTSEGLGEVYHAVTQPFDIVVSHYAHIRRRQA